MDVTHYLFAFFVFVLVCAAIWLFGRVMRGGQKDDAGTYEKEQRLFKLYQNVEDMMNSFEEYVDENKKEIDAQLEELRREAQNVRPQTAVDNVSVLPGGKAVRPLPKAAPAAVPVSADEKADDLLSGIPESVKRMPVEKAIALLLERGLDSTKIAKYLGISNREVTLIMGLKKMSGGANLR